jgi:CheY-like chemotaxis protein
LQGSPVGGSDLLGGEVDSILQFVQAHKAYFDAAHAASTVVNLVGWSIGFVLLFVAWRRRGISRVTVGPMTFQMQEAVAATTAAARNWGAVVPSRKHVDVGKIRSTVSRAFEPEVMDELIGRSILWVDDNPLNNELVVRALRKFQMVVEQVTSTEAGLSKLASRHFDLIISDMGRGENMRAGYELLDQVRSGNKSIPFLIFAGSDTSEFRAEAQKRGAQLSTNDMVELVDTIVSLLGGR